MKGMKQQVWKWATFPMIFVGLLFFSACTDKEGGEELNLDEDYYEFQEFHLNNYEIPAKMYLPDETANIGASTKPEVDHVDSDIKWTINVGPNFQVLIEDYGDIVDLIEVEKKELKDQNFFKINYLIDEKDMIVYERTLVVAGSDKASPKVGVEHKTYHVYAQKRVDNITYELQSRDDGYEKHIIELMAKSFRSFKSNKK